MLDKSILLQTLEEIQFVLHVCYDVAENQMPKIPVLTIKEALLKIEALRSYIRNE